MAIIYPQLDGVKINPDRTLPMAVVQAIRKAYDYLAQASTVSGSTTVVIQDTHQNRIMLFPAANVVLGSFYLETDRNEALYVAQAVEQAHQWVLVVGVMQGLLANRPSDLGANDAGFLYTATDAFSYRWSGSAWVTLDDVRGASTLTTVGAIPKVTAAGTLGQSAMSDNGAGAMSILNSTLAVSNNFAFMVTDSGGTQRKAMLMDTTNPDNLHVRNNQRNLGGKILFDTGAGATSTAALDGSGKLGVGGNLSPAYAVDATGDINCSGNYHISTSLGITTVALLAKLTPGGTVGALNVTGGIITGYIAPT